MRIDNDIPRRAAAFAVLLGALSACSAFHSYFPSRDEVFKPVPVSLGEERVVAGDTSYVLAGRGYRVVTRDRELLPDAKSALDRASAAFRRYVTADPPTVTVRVDPARRRGARPDTARRPSLGADSGRVVTMVGWREDRGARGAGPSGGGVAFSSPALVHAWLAAMADGITHTTAPAAAVPAPPPATDSAARGDARGDARRRGETAAQADDPRIPDWIERAIPALVAGVPDAEVASAQLSRQKDKLIPLRTLLTERRVGGDREPPPPPPSGDRDEIREGREGRDGRGGPPEGERGGGRRAERMGTLEGGRLFDAQALSVAAYLAEREGQSFVGEVFRTVVAGGTLEDALRGAQSVAHDLDGFEHGWRGWLDSQAGKVGDRPRSGRG